MSLVSAEDKRRIVAQNISQLQPVDQPWEESILAIRFPDGSVFRGNGLSLNYLQIIADAVGGEVFVQRVVTQVMDEDGKEEHS